MEKHPTIHEPSYTTRVHIQEYSYLQDTPTYTDTQFNFCLSSLICASMHCPSMGVCLCVCMSLWMLYLCGFWIACTNARTRQEVPHGKTAKTNSLCGLQLKRIRLPSVHSASARSSYFSCCFCNFPSQEKLSSKINVNIVSKQMNLSWLFCTKLNVFLSITFW